MSTIAIIPARSGSKGIPNKNILPLAGRPLIAYSIVAARNCKLIDRVIVSTDSEKYTDIARKYGAETPFLRPTEIAGDTSTDCDYVLHLLNWLEITEGAIPDYVVLLRPTTPLRDPVLIDRAIHGFMNKPSATSLRSAHEMSETAYKKVEIDNGYFKTAISGSFALDSANNPRQSFPKTYSPNGYVDVLRTLFVLENNMIYGDRVMAFVTPRTYEVDTIEDFEFLEWQVLKHQEYVERLF